MNIYTSLQYLENHSFGKLLTIFLYLNLRPLRDPHLCIQYYHIPFSENQIPVGDHDLIPSFYKDDDRMSGNIQIPDAMPVPGIIFLKSNLL